MKAFVVGMGVACVVAALAGCRASEQCSAQVSCAQGSYQACTDGSACRYVTSDGQSFACSSCTDCIAAVGKANTWCGAPGGVGGDGATQTQACMEYVSCVATAMPSELAAALMTYGPSGSCWTSAMTASACDVACMGLARACEASGGAGGGGGGGGGSGGAGGGGGGGGAGGGGRSGGGGAGGSGGAGGGGGGGGGGGPTTYQVSTVAQMRAGAPGDYELDDVVSIALIPSAASPRLFVQDAAGGDFSAIETRCSSTSVSHPCTFAATVATVADGTRVSVKGLYLKDMYGDESFYLDSITVAAPAPMPPPATATLADLSRNVKTARLWFQRVRVDLGTTTLKMFDFSPSELRYTPTNGAVCPVMFGWGMVPSTSSDTVGAACNGTTQPASAVGGTAPSDELLVGNDFYRSFAYSTDCACAATYQETVLTGTSTLGGVIGGVLMADSVYGSAPALLYQYLAPKTTADATFH